MKPLLRAIALAIAVCGSASANSPKLVTDISQSRIDISHRFAGAELLIFGAIQYPGGRLPAEAPGIAVALRGPTEPLTVRRKERVAGIWINTQAVRFESAPSFYSVATTHPVRDLLDERNASIHEIGVNHIQLSPTTNIDPDTLTEFEKGLVARQQRAGLFNEQPYGVQISDKVLYQARIPIPSSVPVGNYQAEIYLIENGEVRARSTTPVIIDKTGFERALYIFAHKYSFFYGIAAVLLAMGMGLLAGAWGKRFRRD